MMRWRKKVEEYIELRRSLGFKLLDANNGLIQFASFLEQSRAMSGEDARAGRIPAVEAQQPDEQHTRAPRPTGRV